MKNNPQKTKPRPARGGKKVWVKPDLVILAVKNNTKGGPFINDDGVTFSS